jgi:hypothetical protein
MQISLLNIKKDYTFAPRKKLVSVGLIVVVLYL